jgi:hypothetical protein
MPRSRSKTPCGPSRLLKCESACASGASDFAKASSGPRRSLFVSAVGVGGSPARMRRRKRKPWGWGPPPTPFGLRRGLAEVSLFQRWTKADTALMLIIVRAAHVVVATGAEELAAAFLELRTAVGAGSDQVFRIERRRRAASFHPAVGTKFLEVTHVELLVSDGPCRARLSQSTPL